jgi:hypothetical protein
MLLRNIKITPHCFIPKRSSFLQFKEDEERPLNKAKNLSDCVRNRDGSNETCLYHTLFWPESNLNLLKWQCCELSFPLKHFSVSVF